MMLSFLINAHLFPPTGEVVDFSQYMDINIMTGALKMFLRELPVPVISFDAYNEIMRATGVCVCGCGCVCLHGHGGVCVVFYAPNLLHGGGEVSCYCNGVSCNFML